MSISNPGSRKPRSRIFHFLCLAALLLPLPVFAAEPMVAAIVTGNLPRYRAAHEAFTRTLEAGGGQVKPKVFVQTPNADRMSLANAVRRAASAGAKIIVAYGAPAAEVAKKEAHGVPVVFADVYDPVALGLVKTLVAPGVEMTGASSTVPLEELVQSLLRVKPVKRIGVLFTGSEIGSALQAEEMATLGKKNGFSVMKKEVASPERVPEALTAVLGDVDAVYLTESVALIQKATEAVELARTRGVPTVSQIPGLGAKGAILNLEADPDEQGKLIAVHTLQILAGQKAFILPVRTPKKIELVINRSTARQLSLTVPEALVAQGGRVID